MVQNHLLQLLCLVAMEPPTDLTADSVRDEKLKVVRALRKYSPEQVAENVVRAQYAAGAAGGKEVPGYRTEDRVNPQSETETFVAYRAFIDNWRWDGVPIYVRVGKRMPGHGTEIAIQFKNTPGVLFNAEQAGMDPNILVIRIQPDEGISLRIQSKRPGAQLAIEPVKMDFHYGTSFGKASPEAYERLLLDAMSGDATLFARRDEVENAWKFVDQIEHAWHQNPTYGSEKSRRRLAPPDAAWRHLALSQCLYMTDGKVGQAFLKLAGGLAGATLPNGRVTPTCR
jgi:glucose-6-phosphate 1-dehydrogenase